MVPTEVSLNTSRQLSTRFSFSSFYHIRTTHILLWCVRSNTFLACCSRHCVFQRSDGGKLVLRLPVRPSVLSLTRSSDLSFGALTMYGSRGLRPLFPKTSVARSGHTAVPNLTRRCRMTDFHCLPSPQKSLGRWTLE